MGVTDLQVLQAFKKGQLELFYRRIYRDYCCML